MFDDPTSVFEVGSSFVLSGKLNERSASVFSTISSMAFAPKHDWTLFEARCREARVSRLRSQTTDEAWMLYLSMHDLVAGHAERLPNRAATARWDEKLAIRRKLAAAFSKLDEMKRGCGPANNSGGCHEVAP